MVGGIAINLFDFQEKAVLKLIDLVADSNSKQTITVKSPTGSGKTIILIDFVEEYLTKINSNAAFIWLCPGKGVRRCVNLHRIAIRKISLTPCKAVFLRKAPRSLTGNW